MKIFSFSKSFAWGMIISATVPMLTAQATEIDVSKVYVKDQTLYYQGNLTEQSNKKVVALLKSNPSVNRLSINSKAGSSSLGKQLGDIVYENQLDVETGKNCIGACANYVFPAGKIKLTHRDTLLAWGGNREVEQNQTNDKDFYEKIGVDPVLINYGWGAQFPQNKSCKMWTYTDDALTRFGIAPLELIDGPRVPRTEANLPCVFEIGAKDIHFPNSKLLAGEYSYGPEVSSFQAYGSKKAYWLESYDKDISLVLEQAAMLNARQTEEPYQAIYIKAEMYCSDQKASEGFAAEYDGVCTVYRLNDLSFLPPAK